MFLFLLTSLISFPLSICNVSLKASPERPRLFVEAVDGVEEVTTNFGVWLKRCREPATDTLDTAAVAPESATDGKAPETKTLASFADEVASTFLLGEDSGGAPLFLGETLETVTSDTSEPKTAADGAAAARPLLQQAAAAADGTAESGLIERTGTAEVAADLRGDAR